jgi:hypothetical protein
MKKITIILFWLVPFFICLSGQLRAQYTFFNPQGAFAIEVSLPNTDLKRLPIYRNSISSLLVAGDHIIGGTSAVAGKTPFVFTASLSKQNVTFIYDLEDIIPGQQKIPTGFCKGKSGQLYGGTIANEIDPDLQAGGHLFQTNVDDEGVIHIKDLGIPVPGEGILALTINAGKTMLFGITHPSGLFFTFNLETGAIKQYEDIAPSEEDLRLMSEYALSPMD